MGKLSDMVGVLFWASAFLAFTIPVWGPVAGVIVGFLLGAAIQ